jgi:uncharacterized repeat protein (TIGR02543 family)
MISNIFFRGKEKYKFLYLSIISTLILVSCTDNTPIYDVNFESNGGSVVESHRIRENNLISQPSTQRIGHSLIGWYKENTTSEEQKWNFSAHRVNESLTLYAQWSLNNYTITFNSNGGTSVAPLSRPYGSNISKPTNPTKSNVVFDNWYSDTNLTKVYLFSTMPAENITLFAKWNTIQVSSVVFTYDKLGLAIGENYQMAVTVSPSNAFNRNLSWSSSNTSVATVSASGFVSARAVGTATIRATSSNGITANATLTVYYAVSSRLLYETEPNGTKSSSDIISANGTTLYGSNSSKSDLDYYSVYLSSNTIITIIFTAEYSIDEQYYLIGIENSTSTLKAMFGSTGVMQYRTTTAGIYYIGVLYSSSSPYSNGDLYGMYVYWF